MGFSEDDLRKMGVVLLPDGSYGKPRKEHPSKAKKETEFVKLIMSGSKDYKGEEGLLAYIKKNDSPVVMRKITLNLFGIPMPKQSVRSSYNESLKSIRHYQPKEMEDRVKDYRRQIRTQLPKDFVMFSNAVHVRKMHFVFPPLKAFHKQKGKMDAIRNGEIFYKETKPDLPDNLKKLPNDSMSGLVWSDDSIVVTETDTAKYYGLGGLIIIELEGY